MSFNIKRCAVKLKQRFGSTQDMTRSGFLLPDATTIPTWSPSKRGPTHIGISSYAEDKCKLDRKHEDFDSAYMDLLNSGAIAYRFIGKPSDCDVSTDMGSGKKPTAEQLRLLKDAKKICGDIRWGIYHRWAEYCMGGDSKMNPRWMGELNEQWETCNKTYEELKGP